MSETVKAFKKVLSDLTMPGSAFELTDRITADGNQVRGYKHAKHSLRDIYEASLEFGDRPFVVYEGERYSFSLTYRLAANLASCLIKDYGIAKGDRVAIAMRNSPEWVIAFMAITAIGGIAVPLNSWGEAEELEYGLTDSGSRLVFVDQRRLELLANRLGAMGVKAVAVRTDLSTIVSTLPPASAGNISDWSGLVDADAHQPMPDSDIAQDDPAMIMYTSGTTGKPKGATSTHGAITQSIVNGQVAAALAASQHPEAVAAAMQRQTPPASLLSLPLFHVAGLYGYILSALASGSKVVMLFKWDPEQSLKLIEEEKISSFTGAAKMIWDILENPKLAEHDLSNVMNLTSVGAAQPAELSEKILSQFPNNFIGTGYGMTETNAYATLNSGPSYLDHNNSVGLPLPIVEVKISDEEGNPLPVGEVGEICMKGPMLIREYWNKPDATENTIIHGWLHSGDIGYMDQHGLVYIADRKKDMVIRGGENIYCAEIEQIINAHPAVNESAVFGIPHNRWGEEVAVAIRFNPEQQLSSQELQQLVAQHLAGFKVPSYVFITEQPFPRNAMQKIQKHQVREKFIAEFQTLSA